MPYKHNDKYRHKFKKATYKVTNWAEYTDALRTRGDITIWFTDEAIRGSAGILTKMTICCIDINHPAFQVKYNLIRALTFL